MKAKLVEFDESGKTLKTTAVQCFLASDVEPPILEILLPDKRSGKMTSVYISARRLRRLFEKADF